MTTVRTRRRFLTTLAAAGAAGLAHAPRALSAEGALETESVRFIKNAGICIAPQYCRRRAAACRGFYRNRLCRYAGARRLGESNRGSCRFHAQLCAVNHILAIDAGAPITVLGGVHIGCYELFASEGIRTITGLMGKSVGLDAAAPALLSLLAAEVGLDPEKDIRWVTGADPSVHPLELFAAGKIDAYLGLPPEPQILHARKVGHVILRTAVDRPWSEYFCCMLAGNRDYVRRHPVATKRVIRAFLKAADLCASAPEQAARKLVEGGFTDRYEYALQTLKENPYGGWRDYGAEDSVRFYALRLHDLGFVKSSPQKVLAEGTDFRFFDQLKRELKA